MEAFKVLIFSHGEGTHEYYIKAVTPAGAVEKAKITAHGEFPWSSYQQLSAIFQELPVNRHGELITAANARSKTG